MDFRVYLDGIQRIVSGVTLETTCKDIVLCLAQATQQFGKFILVERWRNNERLLNPNDYPIKLLSQWGDYASDVMFIMKRCDQPLTDSSAKLQSAANHNLQLQHQLRQQQPRQYQPNDPNLLASKVNQGNRVENNHLKPTNLINENQDLYGSCIPRKNVYHQEEKLINMPSKSSSQSIPLNQSGISQESPVDIESDYGTNQALMKRPKHPPPYYEAITKSALLSSSPSDPVEASPEPSGMHWLPGEAGNSSNCSKGINRLNCEDQEENQSMVKISRNSEDVKNKQPYRLDEIKMDDVKLSSLQKDTLNANNRQILEINSSINYWDSKFRSLNAQQRQDVLNDSRKLDRLSELQRESMANIGSDELNETNELTRSDMEPKAIEVDKNKLRTQLSEIENQIADCRHSIEQLMDQINQLNLQKEEEELLKRREETKIKTQLIEMTKEKSIEFERQSEQLRMVDEELKESDEMLKERIKKIEKILQDLKEANLQGLSLLPRDELFSKNSFQMKTSQSHVIINPDARNSFQAKQQRPGSTRKMFVPPRELKNAVATSKNPHGVWV